MRKKSNLTPKLRHNWLIDVALALGGVIAILTGIYFLAFPVGGYQGGRNPTYGITILFDRETWDLLHTWGSVVMIAAALIHILIHWNWIVKTSQRVWDVIRKQREGFGFRLTYHIILDAVIGLSFIICAVSGMYFLFWPSSGPTGPTVIFSKSVWDLIHTWSGVLMTFTALLHVALHWKWIVNITQKMFRTIRPEEKNSLNTSNMLETGNQSK
jgi:hypothetical protein